MSEHDPHEHTSFIKTPKQLLVVVVLSFVVPVLLIALIANLALRSVDPSADAKSEEAISKRLKPVGQVIVAEGSDVPGQRTGKQVTEAVCAACHATGALNAPKIGDKAAWAPHLKEGLAHLTQMAIKGVRQMPPRGGDPQLSDAEVERAVAYMANQSGASFKEPPVQPVTAKPAVAGTTATATTAAVVPADAASAKSATGAASAGPSIYASSCVACHGAGIAGAPKTGDKAAWAPRMSQGMEALHQAVLKGKGAMPPKGGNAALSDADVKAAVDYIVAQSK